MDPNDILSDKNGLTPKLRVEYFMSNKTDRIQKKVNTWLEEKSYTIEIIKITPFMSYAGKEGYMIGSMIEYIEWVEEETDELDNDSTDPIMDPLADPLLVF